VRTDSPFPYPTLFRSQNDGRPDFALNPFNGPWPTQAQLEARFCSTARTATCVRRDTGQDFLAPPAAYTKMPYSHQASIGMQRQQIGRAHVCTPVTIRS